MHSHNYCISKVPHPAGTSDDSDKCDAIKSFSLGLLKDNHCEYILKGLKKLGNVYKNNTAEKYFILG